VIRAEKWRKLHLVEAFGTMSSKNAGYYEFSSEGASDPDSRDVMRSRNGAAEAGSGLLHELLVILFPEKGVAETLQVEGQYGGSDVIAHR
jgi:hypothetical protein